MIPERVEWRGLCALALGGHLHLRKLFQDGRTRAVKLNQATIWADDGGGLRVAAVAMIIAAGCHQENAGFVPVAVVALAARAALQDEPFNHAFTTLPLRRQDVQTRNFLVPPFTAARTGRKFTFQRRLVTLWAWLMLFPNCGPLPQISQVRAMTA